MKFLSYNLPSVGDTAIAAVANALRAPAARSSLIAVAALS
jgi:hypothetical protein